MYPITYFLLGAIYTVTVPFTYINEIVLFKLASTNKNKKTSFEDVKQFYLFKSKFIGDAFRSNSDR